MVVAPRNNAASEVIAALRIQLAEANARNAELTREIGRLAMAVATANDRILELTAIVERKNSNRKKPLVTAEPELSPSLPAGVQEAFHNRPKPPKLPPKKKKAKKKAKPTGRKTIPEHIEAERHTVLPDACKTCGSTNLEIVDEVVETKLHVVKEHIRRRIVVRKTGCCHDCDTRTTARSLPSPFPRSKATPEFLGWLVYQKFVMLTPLDRLRRDLVTKGIPLAMSYLVTQIERAADLLSVIDGEHWKQLLAGSWMATDATGLKVLVPGLAGTHNGHLEVYRRDEVVVFQYEAEKGSETLTAKLAPFSGVIVADAEHRHNALFDDGRVLEAGCNAHGRRRFRDAEQVQPKLAAEGGNFIALMYIAEDKARKRGLSGDDLRHWRQEHIPPLMKKLRSWMDSVEPTLTPGDPLAKTIRYYRNHWDALFRFVDHPEIPMDNSASEREYQNVAKIRLNSLFAGSTEGAHRAAVLLGIVATCRALKIDPQAYLGWALTRLGTHRDIYNLSAAEMTPAAYARENPPKA